MQTSHPRANLILGLVCCAIFLGAIDLTIVTAVLPGIMLDLNVSIDSDLNRAAWVISGYLLAYTISLSLMGRFSDLYGRRLSYLISLTVFILGSLLVAVAPNLNSVIWGRVVQALGAGAIVPISMALVSDLYALQRRPIALGVIGAVDTAGWMVGHLYGGVLMRAFDDWRLLFWINVPLGMVALGATWWALSGVIVTRVKGRFDWLGALCIAGSITALNLGLSAGAELGQTDFYGERSAPSPYIWPLVGLAIVLLAAFIWWEGRSRDPLIDLALFKRPNVAAASLLNLLLGFALAIALANVPIFVNTRLALLHFDDPDILRKAAWDSGWLLSALTLSMAAAAVPGGWLGGKLGERLPAVFGLILAIVGFGLMSQWQADSGYLAMSIDLLLAGIGLGLLLSPIASLIIAAADEHARGTASALVISLRLVGMTIGIAIYTLWGVQRQDELRRAPDPLATSDPISFLLNVVAQVVGETFMFALAACTIALAFAFLLRPSINKSV